MDIPQILYDARMKRKLTRKAVAEFITEAGTPTTAATIRCVENRERTPSPALLVAWAGVLDIDVGPVLAALAALSAEVATLRAPYPADTRS